MKRQKLKRRTYRPVSKKVKIVKKIIWRILFVLICAAALTVLSVYLGSWLKERAAQIDGILATDDSAQTESSAQETLPPAEDVPTDAAGAVSAYLDVTKMTGADIEEYIYALDESYNTVSINITSDEGKLIYVSPALLEYVKLDSSDITASTVVGSVNGEGVAEEYEIDVLSNIKTALSAAKRKELRVGAVYTVSPAVMQKDDHDGAWEIDAVIASELYELGFDEVLVDGLFTEEVPFDVESVNIAAAYTVYLKERAEIKVGLMIPEDAVLISANASIVNTLCGYADFLGMYVSCDGADAEEAYSIAYEEFHSVKGALSAYNVRAVIVGEDEHIAAAVSTALRDLASVSVQFTFEVASPVYSAETAEDVTETEPADTAYNENANRKDDYIYDTEPEEGAAYDTDAPEESGDGSGE